MKRIGQRGVWFPPTLVSATGLVASELHIVAEQSFVTGHEQISNDRSCLGMTGHDWSRNAVVIEVMAVMTIWS